MSKYALSNLRAEDVMIYGDNGKGWCPRIADCTPCEGEEKHLSYAQAEKNAKFLVKCATHHDELVAAVEEGRQLAYRESLARASGELGEPYLKDMMRRFDVLLHKVRAK